MKSKVISVLFALVLALSLSLVMAVPAGAVGPVTRNVVPFELGGKASGNFTAEWVVDNYAGSSSVHLETTGGIVGITGDEARILIDASAVGITTLADIETISWWVSTKAGYSPHIDITLDVNGDSVVDPEDMLTAELAVNNTNYTYPPVPGADEWRQTFEMTIGDGFDEIDATTTFWVTKMGAGTYDAPFGTLDEWRTTGGQQGTGPDTGDVIPIYNNDTPVVKLEIEVDNWIVQSKAYVDDIAINGDTYYGQIQDAVDSANPNNTISVAAGTYIENITIDRTLTLEGAQVGENARGRTGPESIINAQGVPIAVLINGAETVATFDGFTVDNYDTIGILAGAFKDILQEVPLGDDPIAVHLLNNIVKPPTVAPPHNNNIQVGAGTTGTIIGNEVSGALLESPDWSGSGILVGSSNDVVISNNYVHNSEGGIQVLGYVEYQGRPAAEDNVIKNNLVEGNECGISVQGNTIGTIIIYNDVLNNDVGIGSMAYDLSWPEHSTPSGTEVHYNNIVGSVSYGVESVVWGSHTGNVLAEEVDATNNYWGNASGPDGPQSFTPATYTGLLPGTGNRVSANVKCMPWLTREFQEVIEDDISYFGVSFPALKGWNIVSTPLALDAHVTVTVDTVTYTANTWGGLLNLGKIAEVDDYALKLHYTLVDGVRVYTPIYYYDSNSDSPDFGWRKATASTEVNPVDAYYIRMMASDSIPIPFSPDLSVPSKKLYHGWNLVGCAYMDVMFAEDGQPLETALATIAEVSSLAGDVTGYSQVVSPPVNQMPWIFIPPETYIPDDADGTMLMGRGYWVFMENPGTLAGLTFTPISLSGPPAPPPPPGVVTEVSFQWYPVTIGSADLFEQYDDDSFEYTLPWTFPFAGKDIVAIEVTSNGLIELLEFDEICDVGSSYDDMMALAGDYPDSDIIFAWFDDLDSGTYGFYGVEYVPANDVVVVHWETETNDDESATETPECNYFQLWLFPDGSIKWNFKEFNYVLYGYDLGTGIYDSTSHTLFNVAYAMGEPDRIFNTPEKSYETSGEYMP